MEILVIAGLHALVTYCFCRFVSSEGLGIAFVWINVPIAALTGNPIFTTIDIAAVFAGGIFGRMHRKEAEERLPPSNLNADESQEDFLQRRRKEEERLAKEYEARLRREERRKKQEAKEESPEERKEDAKEKAIGREKQDK